MSEELKIFPLFKQIADESDETKICEIASKIIEMASIFTTTEEDQDIYSIELAENEIIPLFCTIVSKKLSPKSLELLLLALYHASNSGPDLNLICDDEDECCGCGCEDDECDHECDDDECKRDHRSKPPPTEKEISEAFTVKKLFIETLVPLLTSLSGTGVFLVADMMRKVIDPMVSDEELMQIVINECLIASKKHPKGSIESEYLRSCAIGYALAFYSEGMCEIEVGSGPVKEKATPQVVGSLIRSMLSLLFKSVNQTREKHKLPPLEKLEESPDLSLASIKLGEGAVFANDDRMFQFLVCSEIHTFISFFLSPAEHIMSIFTSMQAMLGDSGDKIEVSELCGEASVSDPKYLTEVVHSIFIFAWPYFPIFSSLYVQSVPSPNLLEGMETIASIVMFYVLSPLKESAEALSVAKECLLEGNRTGIKEYLFLDCIKPGFISLLPIYEGYDDIKKGNEKEMFVFGVSLVLPLLAHDLTLLASALIALPEKLEELEGGLSVEEKKMCLSGANLTLKRVKDIVENPEIELVDEEFHLMHVMTNVDKFRKLFQ
ncbi:hypothetical protein ADUPG1_009279 [Aduncisulcus paluster]|uniref:Uncharacterized protein n=1 Tax=Aduncisulcus paluster TaxID=2918883 RepID=A0ABQ5KX97_9EUKA|nr:hypothetical protein ADUPG1_009279 [Aduncisulcus paluster]|eukprot:gnl/Carplike_NY0171/2759_a3709_333.p1 GENE.gnl/Carplike_NY0171/2759_a3709_333~~gnl/Carplike_NY0171/2759_a3709_333.p1  ORF type:complete len:549 (-),score=154.16 gnl/Carplike_NY0171/2759_a3709_333:352-1998(-)